MTRAPYLIVLVLLAFVGIADSVYLAESAMTDTALVCDISGFDGCNVVAQSPYAHLFEIPLGVYGVVFYFALLLLLGLVKYAPRRLWYQLLMGVSAVGVIASLYFLAIQFFLIQATCIYCLVSALVTFVTFPLTVLLYKRFAPQLPAVIP
jgi:uncharacterized membrane protein